MNPSAFDFIDLPNTTLRGFVVTAKEDNTSDTIPDFLNETVLWEDCPAWIKRSAEIRGELQSYRLISAVKAGYQQRRFVFAPNLTREQAQTPYRSYYETEPSMFWPKVVTGVQAYKRIADDSYLVRPYYKDAYQGPTRVRIEEFFSPTPFEIPFYEPMLPKPISDEVGIEIAGAWFYSVGSVNIDSSLHDALNITLTLNPSLTVGVVTYTEATLVVAATNYTDWPAELVVDDRQREVLGGFVRRRVTALRPMIVRVTLPTSADITSTTATLGGTVTIQDNAIVESRGIVYALTSEDSNPEVGNSMATSEETTGTTGLYTQAVTGLTPSSNYSYKPWALTSQGVRVYGPVGTFTTAAP